MGPQTQKTDTNTKLGAWNPTEEITLITWLSDDTLGLVGSTGIYNWKVKYFFS